MRIPALVTALLAVFVVACEKTSPEPVTATPLPPEPAQEIEKPDTTKYPLIGDYAWRVVTHKMIRKGNTTINNWNLTMKFSSDKVRHTYNGGASADFPVVYNADTLKITFRPDSIVTFWKSMHLVDGKYEWHLESANCHCASNSESFDVYHLRR